MVIYLVGWLVSVLFAGIYCERNSVNTANIAPKIFLRSFLWPLFVLNGIIWGLGLAFAVAYGHAIAPAVKERFKVR